ncbi:MAG: sulfite exporter TauE/SafE family protein [Planctomycetes bacterium]|nr:sulfite exporter TauE/SafE family protein [Planctomycetota bacterium]
MTLKKERLLSRCWNIWLIVIAIGLIYLTFKKDVGFTAFSGPWQCGALFLLAFFAEYIDSSLGMGYGTTLTPLLMILGFSPLQIVPAILLSEFVSGISAGVLHHKVGNVNLGKGSKERKIIIILALCSAIGGILAVFLALNLPKFIVKLYIGIMILCIGLFILIGKRFMGGFSWKKILGLGSIAAFNKGISGGGYGPLVTGGQVLVGVEEKAAIGITSFAEGVVCFVGLGLYVAFHGLPVWTLALPLTLGAAFSVPAATWTVKILPGRLLRSSIGYATLFLGLLTLIKLI